MPDVLAGILSQRYRTLKTPGNLNGDIGAPLTLLSLTGEHQAAVIETGCLYSWPPGRIPP